MSADLLRRAAKELRELGEAATPGPWAREWAFSTHFVVPEHADTVAAGNVARLKRRQRADADFIALMHPPVALALAELLETLATMPEISNRFDLIAAESLARAILREPEAVEPR